LSSFLFVVGFSLICASYGRRLVDVSVLEIKGLSHSFGGLMVVNDLSFTLDVGERVALIGPNGAGKTTLINLLSGMLPAQQGRISFFHQNVSRMPPERRVELGLARSFQIESLFPNISLLANVLLAVQGTKQMKSRMIRPFFGHRDNLAEAQGLLEMVNLWDKKDDDVNILSHGERRLVEILMALASKPKLLMLDEPSAGLASGEIDNIISIIRSLERETTVFFCAHDMDVVFTLADRVIVLYYGKIIADGSPKDIQDNPQVREIYLGLAQK
jgi:branched-chain amino acid transport system ATP-binding protein